MSETERRLPQSRIQELGIEELVDRRLEQGVPYEQICKEVKEQTGEDISLSAIWRWNNRLRRATERMRRVHDLAERVVAEAKEQNLDMARFAGDLLLPRAIEAVADLTDAEMGEMTPKDLSLIIKRLSDAGVSRGHLRNRVEKGVREAKDAILAELEKELKGEPELLARMREKAEAAAANAAREASA